MKIFISRSVNQGVREELELGARRRKKEHPDVSDVDEFIQPKDGESEVDQSKQANDNDDETEVTEDED